VTPPRRAAAVALAALLAAAAVATASCGGSEPAPPPSEAEGEELATDEVEPPDGEAPAPLARLVVAVYYPSADGNGLTGETREIFDTRAPADRAKQIVTELLGDPTGGGAHGILPSGTRLRQVYVTEDGTAWIDFSSDLQKGLGGGSTQELLVVYSIVNSIALNVAEIERVGILIDGAEVTTLNGHLDMRRPFAANRSLILDPAAEQPAQAAPPPEPERRADEAEPAATGPV
jgi:spore germination protein GerM